MAGGVLVEQGVEEDGLERPDPAGAVDERELAETVPPSSFAQAARSVSAFSSASIFTARPPSNSTRMPLMIEP